ncbi:ABC transporter substrate-binding protein [Flexivirga endophytica]|uniref:ABC transporter substrate-binding protein n=1 Tax=Flexivirga endophytica TaxID=1849103 RepID=A0A916SVV7_9MICO|nr:extracellular solute-binding protein [Flexivirga endophytica]GGB18682.1 ABC transporter substrate-binding protein [Flexivirga endophytica]GHB36984.1 ABC transporter substrate-binding protein [Flexivirga endophytica]
MTNELARRTVLLGGIAGLSLTASACSVTGGGKSKGGSGSGKGTISALFMKQAGYSEADIHGMIASFESKHPDIKVKPTFVAYEALHDKVVTAAPAGTYDVELIDVIWPAEFASGGLVTDITSKMPEDWHTRMLGGALNTAEYQDKYYGVPWGPSTKLFYYNTAMLQKIGASKADLDTWDHVLAVSRKLKSHGVCKYPIAWSWAQAEALICDYAQLLGAFGGSFLDSAGKLHLDSDAGVKTLTWMCQTLKDGLTNPGSTTFLEDDVSKSMAQGQTAFSLNWDSTYRDLNDRSISKVVGKNGVMATPKGPSGKQPGVNGAMALSIAKSSKNQDAAWKFIEYVTGEAIQERYIKSSASNWKASYDKPKVIATNKPVFDAYKVALRETILRPAVPGYNKISQGLQVEIQKALLGKKTPSKALRDAQAASNT